MLIDAAPWVKVVSAILIAFLISIAMTPAVKAFAARVGAIDVPDHGTFMTIRSPAWAGLPSSSDFC